MNIVKKKNTNSEILWNIPVPLFCSKRSNFINRLTLDKKQGLVIRLTHLAEVSYRENKSLPIILLVGWLCFTSQR